MTWRVVALAAAVFLAALVAWLPGFAPGVTLFLLVTGTVGVLHGALDLLLICTGNGATHQLLDWRRVATYAACVAVTVLLLLAFPVLIVPLLLAVSVVHFGGTVSPHLPTAPRMWAGLMIGAAPLAAPTLLSYAQLHASLAALPSGAGALTLDTWWAATVVWALAAGAFAWSVLRGPALLPKARAAAQCSAAEVVTVLALNLLLEPLAAFAVYFGLMHCPRHITAMWQWWHTQRGGTRLRHLPAAVALACVATLALTVLVVPASAVTVKWAWVEAALLVITAITVPHTLVVAWRAGEIYVH